MSVSLFLLLVQILLQSANASLQPSKSRVYRQLNNITTSTSADQIDAFATSCNAVKLTWLHDQAKTFVSSSTFLTTAVSTSESFSNFVTTTTSLNDSRQYTLCDGYPRLNGSTSVEYSYATFTINHTTTFLTTSAVFSPLPTPTCIIPEQQCSSMQAVYNTSVNAYLSWDRRRPNATSAASPTAVICGIPTYAPPSKDKGSCFLADIYMNILYWPVTTVSGDLCKGNGSTVTPAPTISGQPNTIIYKNVTLTSPSIYYEFRSLATLDEHWYNPRLVETSIIGYPPEAVSTVCQTAYTKYSPPKPVNLADFNFPVPASAYQCQPDCIQYPNENVCSTIWDDFKPAFALPSDFLSRYPRPGDMRGCMLIGAGGTGLQPILYDPPTALVPAQTVMPVSVPSTDMHTKTTPASPSSPLTPATPTPTHSSKLDAPWDSAPTESQLPSFGQSGLPLSVAKNDPIPSLQGQPASNVGLPADTPLASPPSNPMQSSGANSLSNMQTSLGALDLDQTSSRNIGEIIASIIGDVSSGPLQNIANSIASSKLQETWPHSEMASGVLVNPTSTIQSDNATPPQNEIASYESSDAISPTSGSGSSVQTDPVSSVGITGYSRPGSGATSPVDPAMSTSAQSSPSSGPGNTDSNGPSKPSSSSSNSAAHTNVFGGFTTMAVALVCIIAL